MIMALSLEFRVHSVSPLPLEKNKIKDQVFASVILCAEPINTNMPAQGQSHN